MKIQKKDVALIRNLIKNYPAQALGIDLVVYELDPIDEKVGTLWLPQEKKTSLPYGVIISITENPKFNERELEVGDVIQYNEGSAISLGTTSGVELITIFAHDAKLLFKKKFSEMETVEEKLKPIKPLSQELSAVKKKKLPEKKESKKK